MLVTGQLRGGLRAGSGRGDQRPLCQACEDLAPHAPGLLAVPLGQPRKVVPVTRGRRQPRAVSVGGVEGEQLTQQQRPGPAVEQDVMVGHHETVGVRCETHQDETDQRRLGQVEAGVPVRPQQPVQFGAPVGLRQPRQVVLQPVDGDAARHDLDGCALASADEAGPQIRVAGQHLLRGAAQPVGAHVSAESEDQLHDVGVGLPAVQQ
ncbi:hypothetical protein GCM10010527_52970 [Streptomyces drozdowiczii]